MTITWVVTDRGKSTRYIYSGIDYATFLKKGGVLEQHKKELKNGGTGFKAFIKFKNGIAKNAKFDKETITAEVDDVLSLVGEPYHYEPDPF